MEIEATKILDKELYDLTFNGPFNIYPEFEAATISATSENCVMIDVFRGVSEHLVFSPDMINEYDIIEQYVLMKLNVFTNH